MLDGAYKVIKSFERRLRRKMKAHTNALPDDFDAAFTPIYNAANPFTMTGALRMNALFEAVKYITNAGIAGDIVECGVWRGGSAMVAALTLLHLNSPSRDIWLYDTYEGMSEPSDKDITSDGRPARERWKREQRGHINQWCHASIEDVQQNLTSTGYPPAKLHFVKGKVEETIPGNAPDRIAILRLDTDWYESTYHEFIHLYPRLAVGGVLILDDYGAWKGAREATDKYLSETGEHLYLGRIDEGARAAIKIR